MLGQGRLPAWLYEPLPYLYAAAGFIVGLVFQNALGILIGAVLVLMGAGIGFVRFRHRTGKGGTPDRSHKAEKEEVRRRRFAQFVWGEEYRTGHEVIDGQHRKLFELGNTLLLAVNDRKQKLDVELLFEEFIQEMTSHFCTEETLLVRYKHPMAKQHSQLHRILLERCRSLADSYHRGKIEAGDVFQFVAYDVIAGHIKDEDLKMMRRMESVTGLGPTADAAL